MNDLEIPPEAPPPYSKTAPTVPKTRNGIPPSARRSLEDELRELPQGWIRQYDVKHGHQFYVDTRTEPFRSIWHHPYDDEEYLSTLDGSERERIQTLHRVPTKADMEAESTDDETEPIPSASSNKPAGGRMGEKQSLGRRMKDKITGSTHEEREERRRRRAEEERRYYEQHRALRMAMARAMETGQPQPFGKDRDGHDLYVQPPSGPGSGQMYGYPGAGQNYRFNPYASGVYQNPNARFIRPQAQYGRPYYGGYGGGLGLPLAAGLGGGLLLGGLLGAGI